MTRSPGSDRPRAARPPGRKDPYGLLPSGTPLAAILSIVGLVLIGLVTLSLVNGNLPFGGGSTGNGNAGPGATDDPKVLKTPTPSDVVVVPTEEPGLEIPGTLVYAKAGNIWLQADGKATQLTNDGNDSMPSFSEDGSAVYFVRTRKVGGRVERRRRRRATTRWTSRRSCASPRPAARRPGSSTGSWTRPGKLKWMGFIQGPGRLARRRHDRDDQRPARSQPQRRHAQAATTSSRRRSATPAWTRSRRWATRTRRGGPDGKRLAYVRNGPRRRQGHAPDLRLHARHEEGPRGHGPGLPAPGVLAGRQVPRRHADERVRDGRRDPRRRHRRGAPQAHRATATAGLPSWSPAGDQIAYLHVSGQVVDLRMAQLEGSAPAWTVGKTIDLTTQRRPRQRLAAGLVRARGPAPEPTVDRASPAASPAASSPPRRDRVVPRAARRADGRDPDGPVRRRGPGPRRAAGGLRADARGRRGVRAADRRGVAAARGGRQAEPRLLRGARVRGHGRARAAAGAGARPTSRSSRTPSAATSDRRRRSRPSPSTTSSAPTPSPSTRTSARRPSRPCSSARPVRLRPVPDLEPGRRASCRASRSPRIPPPGIPAEPLWARVARRATAWGPGGTVGLVVGATAPAEMAAIRALAPGLAFLVPGVGAQGGEIAPVLAHGPATAPPAGGRAGRRAARQRVAGHRAGGPRCTVREGGPTDPGERLAEAAAAGPRASLCYPDARQRARSGTAPATRSKQVMPFINGIGPGELIIILIIALIVVGPGKLPDVGSALGKSIREFRKAATDVKEATSLDPAPAPAQPAPAPSPAVAAGPAAPVAAAVAPAAAPSRPPSPSHRAVVAAAAAGPLPRRRAERRPERRRPRGRRRRPRPRPRRRVARRGRPGRRAAATPSA